MNKQERIKELDEQGYTEEATVYQIKAEFPYSTKSYNAEQKIRDLYQEAKND